MPSRTRGIIILIVLFLLLPIGVSAQDGQEGSVGLSSPNIDSFPFVEIYLNVYDNLGRFVRGLTMEDMLIYENGISIPLEDLEHLHGGVQFVTVLNPGRSFALRNSNAVSRYDFLIEALSNWANRRSGSTIDDLNLLVNDGPQVSHISDPGEWQALIETVDRETARDLEPDLDILSRAIDLVSDPPIRTGMGRAVLFITPPLEGEFELPLIDLAARAVQNNVQINVWMVSTEGAYQPQAAEQLMILAEQTGGEFFVFTGDNQIPDPETYLEPLRNTYRLEYLSRVRENGEHQVNVEVQTPFGTLTSLPQSFEISIQPPDPAFISPPLDILRQTPMEGGEPVDVETPVEQYSPTRQDFQILVSFPDERVRPLHRTTLFVDGNIVDENLEAPFEILTWDLDDYTTNAAHTVRVEAEDVLGLVGSSIDRQVEISIAIPESSPWIWIYDNASILAFLAILIAGAILFLVLVLGGRFHPRALGKRLRRSRKNADPVSQPVQIPEEAAPSRLPQWVNRLHWPQRKEETKPLAFLSRYSEADPTSTATPIPIVAEETTLGSDPNQSMFVLDDASVEALHASLVRKPDGSFRLSDLGSVGGTWINFTPVSKEGTKLEHGDLVHFGRVSFRFTFRNPKRVRRPVVTVLPQEKDIQ